MTAKKDLQYRVWYRKLNKAVEARVGVSLDDLSPKPYRDWFDEGLPIHFAVSLVLEDGEKKD